MLSLTFLVVKCQISALCTKPTQSLCHQKLSLFKFQLSPNFTDSPYINGNGKEITLPNQNSYQWINYSSSETVNFESFSIPHKAQVCLTFPSCEHISHRQLATSIAVMNIPLLNLMTMYQFPLSSVAGINTTIWSTTFHCLPPKTS